jgi:hypothetical protein
MKNKAFFYALTAVAALLFARCEDLYTGRIVDNAVAPVIMTQPEGIIYTQDQDTIAPLSVAVEAGGDGQLSYQWYRNEVNRYEGGKAILNATQSSYTPKPGGDVEIIYYWVVVTNTNNNVIGNKISSVHSEIVALRLVDEIVNAAPPHITIHPQGAAYNPGMTPVPLSLAAESTDGGQISYQWYRNTVDSYEDGMPIDNETGDTYTPVIPDTVETDEVTYYWVAVTNTNGAVTANKTAVVTSDRAAVTVTPGQLVNAEEPVINTHPVDAEYEEGAAITALSVTAAIGDDGVASYQWYKSSQSDFETAQEISGAANQTYMPSMPSGLTEEQITYYWVKVTNTNNTVNGNKTAFAVSEVAVITVKPYPLLPLKYEVAEGGFVGTYASGETYTAVLSGNAAAAGGTTSGSISNGKQVINTGSSGYIDLGGVVGKALKRLETWTLEMYVYVPTFDFSGMDSGDGPYIFTFGRTGGGPVVFTPIHDARFRISSNNKGTWGTNVEYTNGYDGYWPDIRGSWKHLVFTLGLDSQGRSELSVYENGRLAMYGPTETGAMINYKTTEMDLLDYGYLGRSGTWVTTNATIPNAQFYQFNVYEGAKRPGEIVNLATLAQTLTTLNGDGEQITDFEFTPTAGLTEGDSNAAVGGAAGSFAKMRGGIGDFTYTLVAGAGDTNNSQFTIEGKELKVANTALTFGKKSIRVKAADAAGAILEKTFEFRVGKDFGALKLWYDFASLNVSGTTVEDATGLHTGTLQTGASVGTENGIPILSLANSGSPYFDLGAAAGGFLNGEDGFTISTYIFVASAYSVGTADGASCPWVFCGKEYFNNDTSLVTLTFKGTQVEVDTATGNNRDWMGIWTADFADTSLGYAAIKGQWHHIVYTLKGQDAALWYDGVKAKTKADTNNQTGFAATTYNTLGKPWKAGMAASNYLQNTKYADFRVYNKVLSDEEIAALNTSDTLQALKGVAGN